MMSKRQKIGLQGELWAMEYLTNLGHDVKLIPDWLESYDLVVDGVLPVEVKLSNRHPRQVRPGYYRPNYQFDMARLPQIGDFLVFMIVRDLHEVLWPYLTPSWLLHGRQTVNITSHPTLYRGRLAPYLNNDQVINNIIAARLRFGQSLQLPLFGDTAWT